jgi:protein phosphatase
MVTVQAVTHPGLVRRVNEDGFYYDVGLGLYLVADGMGGHNAGEIASRLALESIEAFVRRTKDDEEFTWPFGVETDLSFDANRLRTALRLANRRVFQMSESGVQYSGMGTTIVSALITKGTMTFATVGDSRLYLVKDHAISRLTVDDSWLATLRAQDPGLDESQFERHPLRHVITKAIGTLGETELGIHERKLEPGDLLMMCTDGLHDLVSDNEMLATLDTDDPLDVRGKNLVDRALAGGGRDNVTVLVLRFDGGADVPRDTSSDDTVIGE